MANAAERASRRGAMTARRFLNRLGLQGHGVSLPLDIRNRLRTEKFSTVFDVGANVGQSAAKFAIDYPGATIYTFEPSPGTFQVLTGRVANLSSVRPFQLAFGSARARLRFDTSPPGHDLHRIAKNQSDTSLPEVEAWTIDGFCAEHGIAAVDYLKIDTEGHDLEVLRGAERMLSGAAVGLAVAECSVNRDNTRHVPFCELHSFMEGVGYRLFGIYEQIAEWPTRKPNLRRVNAAYISPKVIERNPT
jgi:FkbM family methyltransferase